MPSALLRLSLVRDSLGADRSDVQVRAPARPGAAVCSNHPEPCRSQVAMTGDESHVRHRAGTSAEFCKQGVRGSSPLSSTRQTTFVWILETAADHHFLTTVWGITGRR
jgi:hypothetical protein